MGGNPERPQSTKATTLPRTAVPNYAFAIRCKFCGKNVIARAPSGAQTLRKRRPRRRVLETGQQEDGIAPAGVLRCGLKEYSIVLASFEHSGPYYPSVKWKQAGSSAEDRRTQTYLREGRCRVGALTAQSLAPKRP